MRMGFSHAHGDTPHAECTEPRRRFAEDSVHSGCWKKNQLAMIHEAEGLKKLAKILKQKNER